MTSPVPATPPAATPRSARPPAPRSAPGRPPASPSIEDASPSIEDRYARHAPLRQLLAAEAAAEALPGGAVEAADVEQAVWLRLLELPAPPAEPVGWMRGAVRAEVRRAERQVLGARPYPPLDSGFGRDLGFELDVGGDFDGDADFDGGPGGREAAGAQDGAEDLAVAAERRAAIGAMVRTLPGRCPQLVSALMSRSDPTYQEISQELGISQGSLGPLRSRCLGCLRSLLKSRVGSRVVRGNAR